MHVLPSARRNRTLAAVTAAAALLMHGPAAPADGPAARAVEFNRDVRPLLSDTCYACHGPDQNARKADLRLDTEDGARADRGGYHVLGAGKPEESELFKRISSKDPKYRMPPPKFGKQLSAEQIDLVRRWIEQGAPWQKHWSLLAAQRPPVPPVSGPTPARNAVDHFILAKLPRAGLQPAPEADPRTLLRRLSFDLTGLPPTPEDVKMFVGRIGNPSYEEVVDQLLASPHFGERMALYWLDLVRYADTGGYHSDNHRDVALYRDWVIDAFNRNLPFDRFTVEQLAGDLLPAATRDQRIASGYNRLLQTTEEGGAQAKEYAAKYAADRVRNVSSVWLGQTLGCAECHDHKFDPVTTAEFYRFAAFFADVKEKPVGRQEQTPLPAPGQEETLRRLNEDILALQKLLKASAPESAEAKARLAELQKRKQDFEKTVPTTLVSTAVPPRMMRVLPRGNWLDDSGPVVTPGVPAALNPLPVTNRRATRLDLAHWLLAADNPLTARVFVNRLWKLFFGQGLVTTLEDFGAQGAWPTHPELLDWLAVEFRDSGWDVKHMVRLIVTAHTYRQTSAAPEAIRQRDPFNRWLARQGRGRLDAELVRDNALAVSGLLVRTVGGPSVKPYQPAGYWAYLNFPRREWQKDAGPDQYRRGLYTYWCRTFPHPSLAAFDAPSREECTVERPRSNTPQQALVLLNDPTYVEAARAFAERLLRAGRTTDERIQHAFQLALNRPARPEEVAVLTDVYTRHRQHYLAEKESAATLLAVGDRPAPVDLDAAELAAWTSVARVVLNLHEAITRN